MNWLSLLGLEGWVARWRAAIIEGVIAAEDRIELARLEWADQKRRMAQLVVLLVLFGCVAVIALLLLSLAVLVQFWDSPQRVLVAWLLAGGWLLAWVAVAVVLVSIGRQAGNAFALTRRELQQDWRTIKEQL
ncbi:MULTISPECIES: phage holin family protein [Diaphorobacter]|uniref:phage holin family protein n=1 Tax=Diaphorobacter TaxID=238749 RepID=UPI0000DC91B3|nr:MULTISPECIES: phage holin family protein [Diaphorobacter]ABM42303.1 conserved hypothetical protein [Acidovorax sp. JS42]KLR58151.1 membrane protein [Diaphorobacter sp. J5-51]TFI47813.1 phage holin family protein [Diaphorobacter sp. DS2]